MTPDQVRHELEALMSGEVYAAHPLRQASRCRLLLEHFEGRAEVRGSTPGTDALNESLVAGVIPAGSIVQVERVMGGLYEYRASWGRFTAGGRTAEEACRRLLLGERDR